MVSRMTPRDTCSLWGPPHFMTMAFFVTALSSRFKELLYLEGMKEHLLLFQSHPPSYIPSLDALLIDSFQSLRNWRGVWVCACLERGVKFLSREGWVLYLLLLLCLSAQWEGQKQTTTACWLTDTAQRRKVGSLGVTCHKGMLAGITFRVTEWNLHSCYI